MGLAQSRTKETLAMMAIGDSTLALLRPKEHIALWSSGPNWWRKMVRPFESSTGLTRAMGVAGLAFGLWWAFRQEDKVAQE